MIPRIVAFLFGSIIGSFLNVCIHRMPLGESVVWPSSHCPHCKKRIPAYDNIPFLSFLLLGGRCRFCKERISWRYPFVELLTAWLFVALLNHFGLTFSFFLAAVFCGGLIIATFIDIDHRIIPDEISLGGIVVGLVLNVISTILWPLPFDLKNPLQTFLYSPPPVLDAFMGIIIGGGIIYATGVGFDFVYFKLLKHPPIQGETESMGGGDVKLLAMIGAFLGWKLAVMVFFMAPLFGTVVGVFNLIVKKDHTIPYGPFLSLAAVFALFWGEKILRVVFFV